MDKKTATTLFKANQANIKELSKSAQYFPLAERGKIADTISQIKEENKMFLQIITNGFTI